MILQLHSAPHPNEEPVHKIMQAYMDTLCTTQREANLTTTRLYDIPMLNGQDSSKLEDWFMDIETVYWHSKRESHMSSWDQIT